MPFVLSKKKLQSNEIQFLVEATAWPGVNELADKVRNDIELVFDHMPIKEEELIETVTCPIIIGTIGRSPILQTLNDEKKIELKLIEGKRETFSFTVIDTPFQSYKNAIVIAGSDKRGTIYGMFYLSERLGVSPLVNWCDIKPNKKEEVTFSSEDNYVSNEPSVKYRGFFINDEWPAFGTWAMHHFGGFTAKMYAHVFELLLRLKGNYLWPAMWSSRFSEDGPGLLSAELADKWGVIMGMSHHEPCLRHGEEYKYLRGKDSIYGDAWNFRTNEKGIIRFWEDGLKRSGQFENVITVGMRGEADSAILGKEATLADNIALLRDVLKVQNQLIKAHVNENLEEVPRMLALYKEVEPYFYGDAHTPGLMNSPELEGVTLMLCDDNFGNLRTLPTEEMKDHKGGYGMYYHFDYHGAPISYEWVNSTYLPKVWEQMTMAYEFGVKELWIVNVGDIFTNELPLSYFLSLAYDFETWGTSHLTSAQDYTKKWLQDQFEGKITSQMQKDTFDLIMGYTKIAHNRRAEAMNDHVYSPIWYGEADEMLALTSQYMDLAEALLAQCKEEQYLPFFELIYYPAVANLNIQKLQLLTGKNHYYTKQQRYMANDIAALVNACLDFDKKLIETLHQQHDEKWFGMGLSEHIGFYEWNEETCSYPILWQFRSANKQRLVVSIPHTEQYTEGGDWTGKTLYLDAFLLPNITEAIIEISAVSFKETCYELSSDVPWLSFSQTTGSVSSMDQITVYCDKQLALNDTVGKILIHSELGNVTILVPIQKASLPHYAPRTFLWCNLSTNTVSLLGYKPWQYIAIEAAHFSKKVNTPIGAFMEIPDYGKTLSGMKAFPVTTHYTPGKDAPYLEYCFEVNETGKYEVMVYIAPSNPVDKKNQLCYGIQSNEDPIMSVNAMPKDFKICDGNHYWEQGVLCNIRLSVQQIDCIKGLNTLRIYAASPGFVLEKIVIYPQGNAPAPSYLGPKETYYCR